MKKNIFLLILALNIISIKAFAQDKVVPATQVALLDFDKKYIDCIDKWIAFGKKGSSTFGYGFVYFDGMAGLTMFYEGSFTVDKQGAFTHTKIDTTSMSYRMRIPVTDARVAIIPGYKFAELNIGTPDWLQAYKRDTTSIGYLYNLGFTYNSWGESTKAIPYLERAQLIKPGGDNTSLELERAYAYNATGQYATALSIAEKVIDKDTTECALTKELLYAQIHLAQFENATATYTNKILKCSSNGTKMQMAFNIARQYYLLKNKEKFMYWAAEAKKWGADNAGAIESITALERTIGDQ